MSLSEQNFLLTYSEVDDRCRLHNKYAFFELEDDMREFISCNDIVVIEAIEIIDSREIKI